MRASKAAPEKAQNLRIKDKLILAMILMSMKSGLAVSDWRLDEDLVPATPPTSGSMRPTFSESSSGCNLDDILYNHNTFASHILSVTNSLFSVKIKILQYFLIKIYFVKLIRVDVNIVKLLKERTAVDSSHATYAKLRLPHTKKL